MADFQDLSDDQLRKEWFSHDRLWASKCYVEWRRRRLEKKVGFEIKDGGRYIVVPTKPLDLTVKINQNIKILAYRSSEANIVENIFIPFYSEVILCNNNLWDKAHLLAFWNERKIIISVYNLELHKQ